MDTMYGERMGMSVILELIGVGNSNVPVGRCVTTACTIDTMTK